MHAIRLSILLLIVSIGLLGLSTIEPVDASWSGTVYIRADGSIDPPDAPITTNPPYYTVYTLTDNISTTGDGIIVERDNIIINGNGYMINGLGTGWGITLEGRTNVTIKDATVKNFEYGIYLNKSSNIVIIQNIIGGSEIGVYTNGSSGTLVLNNGLSENNYGIFLFNSSCNEIVSNEIVYGDRGVVVALSVNNLIENNSIHDNLWDGIDIYRSNNTRVIGNSIVSCAENGIWSGYAPDEEAPPVVNVTIRENRIENCSHGISTWGFHESMVTYNNVSRCRHDGILLQHSHDNFVAYNRVIENGVYGVHLWNSRRNALTYNDIVDNNEYGIVLDFYSDDNNVSYNIISLHDEGIHLWRSSNNVVVGNNVTGNEGLRGINTDEWSVTWYEVVSEDGTFGNELGSSTFPLRFFHSLEGFDDRYDHIGFKATLVVEVSGNLTVHFEIGSDDGSKLFVDGNEVIDLWWLHGYKVASVDLLLEEGVHTLEMWWYEWEGDSVASFDLWTGHPGGIVLCEEFNDTISDNTVFYSGGDGVNIYNSSDCLVSENVCKSNHFHGITVRESTNIEVLSNLVSLNDRDSLLVGESTNVTMSRNDVLNNWATGIVSINSRDCMISYNNVSFNNNLGIYTYNSTVEINENIIANNGWCGIELWGTNNSVISQNNIVGNGRWGIYLSENSYNNTIVANNITCNLVGIYNYSGNNTACYNNIWDNGAWWGGSGVHSYVWFNASLNWWGDVSGPGGAGLGTGDAVTENVLYSPWLNAPYPEGTPISAAGKKSTVELGEVFDARAETGVEVLTSGYGSVELGVLNYTDNPVGAGFTGDIGSYIDVWINTASGVDMLEIKLYYDEELIESMGVDEDDLRMYWWNGTDWVECSDTGVNTTGDYIWARVNAATTPSLADLAGTPFAAGASYMLVGGEVAPSSALILTLAIALVAIALMTTTAMMVKKL